MSAESAAATTRVALTSRRRARARSQRRLGDDGAGEGEGEGEGEEDPGRAVRSPAGRDGDHVPAHRRRPNASEGTFHCIIGGRQDVLVTQMRRGTLQYCVLAALTSSERYGFDLVRSLAEVDGMVTSEGTIYPLLSRLRRDGLVETTWRESPSGPPRRYYRLTKEGREALDGFRSEWRRFRDAVDHFVEEERER